MNRKLQKILLSATISITSLIGCQNSNLLQPSDIGIGKELIAFSSKIDGNPEIYPSDHFGLWATIKVTE